MLKRILAIVLCLVMVSAFAVTSAVSAKKDDNTSIRQYDITWNYGVNQVVGKLILNVATGHWVADVNFAKSDDSYMNKEWAKENSYHWYFNLFLQNNNAPKFLWIIPGFSWPFTPGGTAHGEGYLDMSNTETVTWLTNWADRAVAIGI